MGYTYLTSWGGLVARPSFYNKEVILAIVAHDLNCISLGQAVETPQCLKYLLLSIYHN